MGWRCVFYPSHLKWDGGVFFTQVGRSSFLLPKWDGVVCVFFTQVGWKCFFYPSGMDVFFFYQSGMELCFFTQVGWSCQQKPTAKPMSAAMDHCCLAFGCHIPYPARPYQTTAYHVTSHDLWFPYPSIPHTYPSSCHTIL